MLIIYMMVGIPASGKTTYAKKICNAQPNIYAYVSRDEIRKKLTGSGKVIMEQEMPIRECFCEAILEKYLNGYEFVFADATHCTPRSRWKFIETLYKTAVNLEIDPKEIEIIPIIMETPYEICFDRNSKRPKEIMAPISDMCSYYKKCTLPSKTDIGLDKALPKRLFYNYKTGELSQVIFEEGQNSSKLNKKK